MKTFESLFAELSEKAQTRPEGSLTVDELDKGTHFIGKKIIVIANLCGQGTVTADIFNWLATHWMIKHGLTLEDVYKHL